MSKPTPGPWETRHPLTGFSDVDIVRGANEIATVWEREGDETLPVEANARLIASAPELYEACKEFVRKVECGEARSVKSYAQMKAAISKAEEGAEG